MSRPRAVMLGDLVYCPATAELGFLIVENPIGVVIELRDGTAVVHWATFQPLKSRGVDGRQSLPFEPEKRGSRLLRWEIDRLGRPHPVCEEPLASLCPLVVRHATEDDL